MRASLRRFSQVLFTPQRPLRRLMFGLGIGAAVAVIMALAVYLELFATIRQRLTDSLYRTRATDGITAIVAIDDKSIGAYGRIDGWPRSVYADLIARLQEGGAKVIAFDVLYVDPSADDAAFAQAMTDARNVVLAFLGSNTEVQRKTRAGNLIIYDEYTYPNETLAAAARTQGHVNVVPDGDGSVRQVPLFISVDGQPRPALALAAYMQFLRLPPDFFELKDDYAVVARRKLWLDNFGQMLIYYFGPPSRIVVPDSGVTQRGTYPVYSLVDVVEGRIPPEVFAGKIVLVGALDASGLADNYATPNSPSGEKMFGVEIHANIIETIHQSLPTVPLVYHNVDLGLHVGPLDVSLYRGTTHLPLREQSATNQTILVVVLSLVAGMVLPFLRWYTGLIAVLLVYGAYYIWAAGISFPIRGVILDLLFPAMVLGFTYLATMIVSYTFEERRRTQINDLFSRYVSAEIAQKIVEAFDQGKLELGGEEREITVLFADIRGFTTLSEGLAPPEVVRMLNLFLEQMTHVVMENGGAINKYIGDNLMAFWNAPYPQQDHAWLATKAGMELLEAVQQINATGQFHTPVQFGIGVNTGPVVVGNIGSRRRLEYTPIGDTVNTASRLCGIAPGGSLYIGARTRALCGDRIAPLAEHHLKVKGKLEPVEVHELRPDGAASPDQHEEG